MATPDEVLKGYQTARDRIYSARQALRDAGDSLRILPRSSLSSDHATKLRGILMAVREETDSVANNISATEQDS